MLRANLPRVCAAQCVHELVDGLAALHKVGGGLYLGAHEGLGQALRGLQPLRILRGKALRVIAE